MGVGRQVVGVGRRRGLRSTGLGHRRELSLPGVLHDDDLALEVGQAELRHSFATDVVGRADGSEQPRVVEPVQQRPVAQQPAAGHCRSSVSLDEPGEETSAGEDGDTHQTSAGNTMPAKLTQARPVGPSTSPLTWMS